MIDGKLLTEELLVYSKEFLHLNSRDEIYFRNLLLREFKEDAPLNSEVDLSYVKNYDVPDKLVEKIEKLAEEKQLVTDGLYNLFSTYIFGLLSPLPSEVNRRFFEIKEKEGVINACKYFYGLSVKNNYIQKTAIGKNLKWTFNDGDKYLEITINLSKPEKDNKDIAKLLTAPKTEKYPKCLLCKENEGFKGSLTHPARENIRTVSLTLNGEKWFVQYSPYAYYDEHCIAISENHTPMHVEGDTVKKVLDFVDYFPNYMIGSNAALPIVGGSILNHEHFQGGVHLMPMHNAKILKEYVAKDYKNVKVGIVDWYNSVIRLESNNREELTSLATVIIETWQKYDNKNCYIFSETDGVKHNTLSPIARKKGDTYVLDMILRNNITTEDCPDGLFHAHKEYHNIKKEGIGLIEAMGLFILPGRLKKQLDMIADILCGNLPFEKDELLKEDNYLHAHLNMIEYLLSSGKCKDKDEAVKKVTDRVNAVCKNILLNTAVFKKDENGVKGFEDFLNACNIK